MDPAAQEIDDLEVFAFGPFRDVPDAGEDAAPGEDFVEYPRARVPTASNDDWIEVRQFGLPFQCLLVLWG
jgi:hypothetical protein